jgi:flagellar biosynthesis protein FliR
MSLRIDIGWLIATLLVSVRVASATIVAPVLGPSQIPAPARVALVLALSACLVAGAPVDAASAPVDLLALVAATLGEAVYGLAFAFGFVVAYAATQVAGRALDIQVGFGAAGILNPATRVMSPLLGTVLGMLMIASFLALDGHLVLIRALAASLAVSPPGATFTNLDPSLILNHSAATFTFGLALAAPVMFMLLLADLAMAVFARSMPQLNIFVLGFAVKIVLGLSGLALAVRFSSAVLEKLFSASFLYWDRLAGGA